MGLLQLLLQSNLSLSLSAALLLLCFITSLIFRPWAENREPPGPRPLPVLGNLLQLDLRRLHLSLLKVRTWLDHLNVSFQSTKTPSFL